MRISHKVGVDDDLSPDQRLALAYAGGRQRDAFATLFHLDHALATAVAAASEPMLGQLRLAWWRDALNGGDAGASPVLAALHSLPDFERIRAPLLAMVNGWESILNPLPLRADTLGDYGAGRGGGLFEAAAMVANVEPVGAKQAGKGWALADLAFHVSDKQTAAIALALARANLETLPFLPKALRPFAMLARFARTDARRSIASGSAAGSPTRLLDSLKVVLTGR